MNSWKLALVGLVTVSASAFAAPVTGGSAAAVNSEKNVILVPKVPGATILVHTDKVTGVVTVEGSDGVIVATTVVPASEVDKACYGCYGPGGLPPAYLSEGPYGYESQFGAQGRVIIEDKRTITREFYKRDLYGESYGGDVGPDYDDGY